MTEIIEGAHPTRMELLSVRKRIDLADKGHSLLKKKRDALVIELFDNLGDVKGMRSQLSDVLFKGVENLSLSESMIGAHHVDSVACASAEMPDLVVHTDTFMGVAIPRVNVDHEYFETVRRNYGLVYTSSVFDNSVGYFSEALKRIVSLIEKEEGVRRMCLELIKTKRRVNALEYLILPRLNTTKKYIQMRLAERERENFSRLKIIKKKRGG